MAMLDLKKALSRMLNTPLVIESGTSGIWTYRKWSDGTAECWGMRTQSYSPSTEWGSTKYVSMGTQTFPSIFISKPVVTATINKQNGSGIPVVSLTNVSATQMGGYVDELCSSNYTYTCDIFFHAYGNWK